MERVNTIEGLGGVIRREKPAEALYDQSETELLITVVDPRDESNSYSARVRLPTKNTLRGDDGRIMDVSDLGDRTLMDSDDFTGETVGVANSHGAVQDAYRNMRLESPRTVDIESPIHTPYELPTLVAGLEDGKILAIAPYKYKRAA